MNRFSRQSRQIIDEIDYNMIRKFLGDCVMVFRESEKVELKAIVVDDIKKEVIAFANFDGRKIYIGVRDDGTIAGVEDADGTALRVSNMIKETRWYLYESCIAFIRAMSAYN